MKKIIIGTIAIIGAAGFSVANAAPINNHQNNNARHNQQRPVVSQRAHIVPRPAPHYSQPQKVVIVQNNKHNNKHNNNHNGKHHYAQNHQHHHHNNCNKCNSNSGSQVAGWIAGGILAGTVLYALAN
ncbi:hypothetical protein LJC18_02190 [Lachnospiraceae bacterium OttesenSCG-928-E19]|nr:hypothetical protein [Lachnospiraceae bacterium OttesenSCG-928-E19]